MKPHVIVSADRWHEYPFNACVFIPDESGQYERFSRRVRWYHTVRATSIEGLYRGVNEALSVAPRTPRSHVVEVA